MARDRTYVSAAFDAVKLDRRLFGFTLAGTVAGTVAAGIVVGVGLLATGGISSADEYSPATWAVVAVALLAWNCITVFSISMACLAVHHGLEGVPWTIGSLWTETWSRRRSLLAWAALSTCVGMAFRALERFGVVGVLGRFLGEVAWAVITAFAIPALVLRQEGPLATVRESAATLTRRFGTNAKNLVNLGAIAFVYGLAVGGVLLVGVLMVVAGTGALAVVGGAVIVTGVVLGVLVSAYFEAVSIALRTMLYRDAAGLSTPCSPGGTVA